MSWPSKPSSRFDIVYPTPTVKSDVKFASAWLMWRSLWMKCRLSQPNPTLCIFCCQSYSERRSGWTWESKICFVLPFDFFSRLPTLAHKSNVTEIINQIKEPPYFHPGNFSPKCSAVKFKIHAWLPFSPSWRTRLFALCLCIALVSFGAHTYCTSNHMHVFTILISHSLAHTRTHRRTF